MSGEGHTYLRTHRIAGDVLLFDINAEAEAARQRAETTKAGRAAATLVKEGPLRITVVSLVKGTPLRTHEVAGALSIYVLRGRVRVTTPAGEHDLAAGGLVALAPGVRHAVLALRDASLVITMSI